MGRKKLLNSLKTPISFFEQKSQTEKIFSLLANLTFFINISYQSRAVLIKNDTIKPMIARTRPKMKAS